MIAVDIHNDQPWVPCDQPRLKSAIRMVLEDVSLRRAEISLAVVDDATIRRLHQRYLGQEDATDVLSFVLHRDGDSLEGEVVVSAETAAATAPRYGWAAADELLLYVIHGALHLAGHDDATPTQQAQMRRQEQAYLARLGVRAYDPSEPTETCCGAQDVPAPGPDVRGNDLP